MAIQTKEEIKAKFVEAICREMCKVDKVDPDMVAMGIGFIMPAGEVYPLWKARIRYAEAITKFFTFEDD